MTPRYAIAQELARLDERAWELLGAKSRRWYESQADRLLEAVAELGEGDLRSGMDKLAHAMHDPDPTYTDVGDS